VAIIVVASLELKMKRWFKWYSLAEILVIRHKWCFYRKLFNRLLAQGKAPINKLDEVSHSI